MTAKEILYQVKDRHNIGTAWQITEHVILEAMELYAKQKHKPNGSTPNHFINLGNDTFVNKSEIKQANRRGNYIELHINGESVRHIWDEDKKIISQFN